MVIGGITIKAIKLMLAVLILGMLVASGAAQEGAESHGQPPIGGLGDQLPQPLVGDHNIDFGDHQLPQPPIGDHNIDFDHYDWLNPGGVTYYYSWWDNHYSYTYPSYYSYPWYYYSYPGYYPLYTYPNYYYTTPVVLQASTGSGDTPVTIQSQGMRGYQVFLDENYIGTEGTGGDLLDGVFNFKVVGNQYHNIRAYDGQFNYPKRMYFARGVLKIINVEPGIGAYI